MNVDEACSCTAEMKILDPDAPPAAAERKPWEKLRGREAAAGGAGQGMEDGVAQGVGCVPCPGRLVIGAAVQWGRPDM